MTHDLKGWFRSGNPWVWLNAAAVSASIAIVAGLLLLIAARGMGHFWPKSIMEAQYKGEDGQIEQLIGERSDVEVVPAERLRGAGVQVPDGVTEMSRVLVKVGNRDVSG